MSKFFNQITPSVIKWGEPFYVIIPQIVAVEVTKEGVTIQTANGQAYVKRSDSKKPWENTEMADELIKIIDSFWTHLK
jgi:antitoxin component of MazEF toxin-antitoxin module